MNAMPSPNRTENDLLYEMYQNLPIGVVLLDSRMKVLSANRKFRTYFPFHPEGPEGFLLCGAVGCRRTEQETPSAAGCCGSCLVMERAARMIRSGCQVEAFDVREETAEHSSCGSSRWFRVSGIPVDCAYERFAVLFFDDITSRRGKEDALRKTLELDMPTKALNKYGLMKFLDSLLQERKPGPFTACMIDFDDFKCINDRYGHLTGDKVLDRFAKIARKNIRSGDMLGRYGGEEFLFVFRGVRPGQAKEIVGRIQSELKAAFQNEMELPVTFSAGMVFVGAKKAPLGRDALIRAMDRCLYQAKAEGKNRIASEEKPYGCEQEENGREKPPDGR